jgi:radical SAM superfamily enzyme YgiQ (UPF0313 family)
MKEDQDNFSRKVLLVKPGYKFFPVGLAYVMSTLERNNIPFDFVDSSFERIDFTGILKQNKYMAVATGGLAGDFRFFLELSKQIKQSGNDLLFILGGNITKCVSPDILFDRMGVDFAVLGEAETAFPGLLYRLNEGGKFFEDLPGIMFKDKKTGSILRKAPIRLDLDSDDIEPAWHRIDMGYYLNNYHHFFRGEDFFPIMTGRGCTGHCSFCSPTIGRFRARKIDNILHEMWKVSSEYKFDLFGVMTEVLFASTEDIIEFCRRYREEGPKKEWWCSLRVDIDTVVLNAMKEAGCMGVSIGAESGSDKILKLMNKGISRKRIQAFIDETKRVQMALECNVMVGSEGETQEDLKETFDLLIEEEVFSNINLTFAYTGTLIYKHAKEKGLIHDEYEHILNEKYLELADKNIAESNYLNVSDFSTAGEMHAGIMKEVRRYLNFMIERFPCQLQMNVAMNTDSILKRVRRYLNLASKDFSSHLQVNTDRKGIRRLYFILNCFPRRLQRHVEYLLFLLYCVPDRFDMYGGRITIPLFSAQCPVCGMKSEIGQSLGNWRWDGLVLRLVCPGCYKVSFSWIGSKGFIEMVRKELYNAENILVFGAGRNATSIIAFGLNGLDMKKIIGFVDLSDRANTGKRFFSHQQYMLSEIKGLNPDVVIITDTNFPNARNQMKSLGCDSKVKMIPLMPDVFPENLLKDKRILFIGADSSLSYVQENLKVIQGCKIYGAIDCRQGLREKCSEIKMLPRTAFFSKDWDVAINWSDVKPLNTLFWFFINKIYFHRRRIILGRSPHPFFNISLWMPLTPIKIMLDLLRNLYAKII